MGSASHWTPSHTAVSVTRVTAVHSATNRGSSSIPVGACHANTVAVRSQTRATPTVTVKVVTLVNCVTQVGVLIVHYFLK